jgi:uncharacterized protein (TIGR00106 family)
MNVIADLTVVPIGVGVSLSAFVAACEDVLNGTDLKTTLHPNGTAIEGEWDAVMDAVKACHERVHAMGAPRIFTTLKIGTRIDRKQTLEDKVDSVVAKQSDG